MKKPLIAALALALALSACGRVRDSRLNPFNWFGGSTEESVAITATEDGGAPARAAADPRPLVAEVVQMRVERMPGGAIVHATGRPPRQGYWEADLVPVNDERPENGTLAYEFRAAQPPAPTRAGTAPSREITAGRFVSDQTLAGVRRIVVIGAGNRRTSSR
ncbi:hypothetical protein EJA01_12060 [Rhodovulum iodosum]|nr:hypothetical protein [Rhodovulum robiginosum]RSK31975.1 hypothetical protein EJA01_12060 [Rhodovulum robiginosum]